MTLKGARQYKRRSFKCPIFTVQIEKRSVKFCALAVPWSIFVFSTCSQSFYSDLETVSMPSIRRGVPT